ncbi:hypothetical protein EV175_001800 [Coemansia sp. RSA 1933]|nr:hypothetical protein EV175_001800 [Coemansia sp. RSA 1933]
MLGENAELPSSRTNAAVKLTADTRKHTRRATSDTVSDMESHGDAPVKRRRESINNGHGSVYAVASGGITKQSTKYRKITTALSSQFARSLSVSSTNGMVTDSLGNAAAAMPGEELEDVGMVESAGSDTHMLHAHSYFIPSSSSSGSSSESPPARSPMSHVIIFPPESDEVPSREFRHVMPGRSLKALEKTRASLKNPPPDRSTLHASSDGLRSSMDPSDGLRSSMDLDAGYSTPISPNFSSSHLADPDEDCNIPCVFTSLLQPIQQNDMCIGSEEALHSAVKQWALGQTYDDAQASAMLINEVDRRIYQLKHILPPLLTHAKRTSASNGQQHSVELYGEQLQEFYRVGYELGSIGEWLYHRQFPFLPTILPALQHELPLLQGIVQISRVAEDMHRLLQSAPDLSASLSEMATQYEDIVRPKRMVYRELLAQDGLTWKTLGLPVDTLLLTQVRQWFAAVTEQCMVRIARVFECRANSASAYSKEEITTDALNQCSHRVLHTAAQCAQLCGNCFPSLAPQVLFIVSECVTWTNNKFRSAAHTHQKPSQQPFALTSTLPYTTSKQAEAPIYRGKQLESRALRLAQACEGILKLLSFTKTILTIDSTLFDAQHLRNDLCTQPALAALQALAASLVEMSWTLAEFLAALRLDGRFLAPSGSVVLFVDVVVRFAKKIAYFGGSKVASRPYIQRHLRQLQYFLGGFDGSGNNTRIVSAY